MLGDEMIDEASRKMALVIAGKGRAAGMTRDGASRSSRRLVAVQAQAEPLAASADEETG